MCVALRCIYSTAKWHITITCVGHACCLCGILELHSGATRAVIRMYVSLYVCGANAQAHVCIVKLLHRSQSSSLNAFKKV